MRETEQVIPLRWQRLLRGKISYSSDRQLVSKRAMMGSLDFTRHLHPCCKPSSPSKWELDYHSLKQFSLLHYLQAHMAPSWPVFLLITFSGQPFLRGQDQSACLSKSSSWSHLGLVFDLSKRLTKISQLAVFYSAHRLVYVPPSNCASFIHSFMHIFSYLTTTMCQVLPRG